MTAVARIRDRFIKTDRDYLKIVGATGQLGYGIPEPAFSTALSHDLDMVRRSCDNVLCLNRTLLCQGTPDDSLSPENLALAYGSEFVRYHHSC